MYDVFLFGDQKVIALIVCYCQLLSIMDMIRGAFSIFVPGVFLRIDV